jgi:predicted metal-dependent phosphoesterase TrpH
MRAALHMHSTYSDGEFTLRALRDIFIDAGCRIIAVTDHADSFDAERLARYVSECADLCDERLLLVPGLEFSCRQRMHILGYGVTTRCHSDVPADVIRHIAEQGGVSVIAHPKDEFFDWIRRFDVLPDGIEAWNSKYDGRHAPRPQTFALIRELRHRSPDLLAFYGIDLHWRHQPRDLHIRLMPTPPASHRIESVARHAPSAGMPMLEPAVTRETLLACLRSGGFEGVTGELRLPSTAELDADTLASFDRRHQRSRRVRYALMQAKRLADAFGLRPPDALKSRLRRWL